MGPFPLLMRPSNVFRVFKCIENDRVNCFQYIYWITFHYITLPGSFICLLPFISKLIIPTVAVWHLPHIHYSRRESGKFISKDLGIHKLQATIKNTVRCYTLHISKKYCKYCFSWIEVTWCYLILDLFQGGGWNDWLYL